MPELLSPFQPLLTSPFMALALGPTVSHKPLDLATACFEKSLLSILAGDSLY